MEARLARLYERLGRRYVPAFLAAAYGVVLVWTALTVGIMSRIEGLSVPESLLAFGATVGSMVPVLGIATYVIRDEVRIIRSWSWDRASKPADVLRAALALPVRGSTAGFFASLALAFPTAAIVITTLGDRLTLADVLAIVPAGLLTVTTGALLVFYGFSIPLRPVLTELMSRDPHLVPTVRGPGLAAKLLLGVICLVTVCGVVVAALVRNPGAGAEGILEITAIAFGFSATVGLWASFVITNTVVSPVRDLERGTRAVGRGALDQYVPITSSDELGQLAASFNEMVAGLRERARLAEDNESLLEEVRASRTRIISASDAERRRVERNIHDGAQQRLVALALRLRLLEEQAASDPALRGELQAAGEDLKGALGELRELARGLHPSVLSTDGLRPALEQLANRAPVPVNVSVPDDRFPDTVESTAYFVASEALANVAKYAQASSAEVSVAPRNGLLCVDISDNGKGGADPEAGSGLAGLADRVAALDGRLTVESPPGAGTRVSVELPLGEIQG
jgi:signal transduction histidine kinase